MVKKVCNVWQCIYKPGRIYYRHLLSLRRSRRIEAYYRVLAGPIEAIISGFSRAIEAILLGFSRAIDAIYFYFCGKYAY